MKFCIIVYGNICSGKTSFCKFLEQYLSQYGFKHFNLDYYRTIYGGKLHVREENAKRKFLHDIKNANYCIYESVGMGRVHDNILSHIAYKEIPHIKVLLNVPILTCMQRLKNRANIVPMPNYGFSQQESIAKLSSLYLTLKTDLRVDGTDKEQIKKAITAIGRLSKKALQYQTAHSSYS